MHIVEKAKTGVEGNISVLFSLAFGERTEREGRDKIVLNLLIKIVIYNLKSWKMFSKLKLV